MASRTATLLVALGGGCAPRGTSATATGTAAEAISVRTLRYACAGGQSVTATYLAADGGDVTFVVLRWNGQAYGLAPAVSASGTRFVGLVGPGVSDRGLEWWEAKGEATLRAFTGRGVSDTRPLLTACRPGAWDARARRSCPLAGRPAGGRGRGRRLA